MKTRRQGRQRTQTELYNHRCLHGVNFELYYLLSETMALIRFAPFCFCMFSHDAAHYFISVVFR